MPITQDTKKKRNLEVGSDLESVYGGDCVIGTKQRDGQVSAKGGKTHCGRPHKAFKLLVKNRFNNSNAGLAADPSYSLRKCDFTNMKTFMSWKYPPRVPPPSAPFLVFLIFFPGTLYYSSRYQIGVAS